jgi:hypothetical protein
MVLALMSKRVYDVGIDAKRISMANVVLSFRENVGPSVLVFLLTGLVWSSNPSGLCPQL